MSSLANVIELPVRHELVGRHALEHDTVLALATADDLASGMGRVVEQIRRDSGALGVEWWAAAEDGELGLAAAAGFACGTRETFQLGSAGMLVLHGGGLDPQVESVLTSLTPILRRRAAEERLARTTAQLAMRNEALEDFAALVAHELKTPLQAALVADDPSRQVEDALDLVDALLQAAQGRSETRTFSSVAESLEEVVEDLGAGVEVSVDVTATLPLPPGPLRVILRNLLSNAAAAGARNVHVRAMRSARSWQLHVDDDGVGLAHDGRYAAGSGLGLSLSRRIAARFGGALELTPRPAGGTRATLEFGEVRP
jgi:signal transduction histidine kinase